MLARMMDGTMKGFESLGRTMVVLNLGQKKALRLKDDWMLVCWY